MTPATHYRICPLCEACCGLEVRTRGSQVEAIRGWRGDVLSDGYLCPKAAALRDLHEEIESRGHRHHAVVHLARQEPAPAAVAQRLGLATGDPVFHTQIVHFDNGVPLQYEDRHVNPAAAPAYLAQDFTRITPTHYLFEVAPLWQAQYAIEALPASAREARLLGIATGDACLVVTRRTVGSSVPITVGRLVHPGTRYQLQGEFNP